MSDTKGQEPTDGLRARKRAATAATIERVSLDLVLQHGYDTVTVEMICTASAVSPRTFFNYFGSKEGAVLGPIAPEPSADQRAAFLGSESTDVMTDLLSLLATTIGDTGQDRDILAARRAVITATPSLIGKQVDRMGELESRLLDLVRERFARQGRGEHPEEARMVVELTGAVMRFSARDWLEGREPADIASMLQTNLAVARRVLLGTA